MTTFVRWRTHDGAAKRRKLAGSYPDTPALAAPRRLFGERAEVPAGQLEVPPGLLGITIDVEGVAPSTVMFDMGRVTEIEAEAATLARRHGIKYYAVVRALAEQFGQVRRRGDDRGLTGIGIGILWTCFNHPTTGERMRRAVSTALRRDGKAHITWYFGEHGLGVSLAKGFVDMEQLGEHAPKDAVVVYTARDAIDDERGH
jgi:hypothetical protein